LVVVVEADTVAGGLLVCHFGGGVHNSFLCGNNFFIGNAEQEVDTAADALIEAANFLWANQ
jgi:hypothetical protein